MLIPYDPPRILSNDWPPYQNAPLVGRLARADGTRMAKSAKLGLGDTPLSVPEIYFQIDGCETFSPESIGFDTANQFVEGQIRWIASPERIARELNERQPSLHISSRWPLARREGELIAIGLLYTLLALFSGVMFVFGTTIVAAITHGRSLVLP